MKVHVLELIGSFEQGGSERQAVQLSRQLRDDGTFGVYVGCLDRKGDLIDDVDWLVDGELPDYPLTSFYDLNFVSQARRCAAFLKAKEIRVIHTHDFYTNIFGMFAGWLAGVPARIASKRETFSKTSRQMFVERQAYRLSDKIVVNAEAVKEFLVKTGVPGHKPEVIYNGVDLERYVPTAATRANALSDLGLSHLIDKRIVVIVANMRSDVKNHSMFLRAVKAVLEEVDNAAFVAAGEGELLESIRAEAASLGIAQDVHFIGACGSVPKLLSVSDVCTLSSRSEGFSNAILEYMASGKPVVATRVGGATEAVSDGETGFLVRSDDDTAMAERIIDLLRDAAKAARFGARGRELVVEKFSHEAQLKRTMDLYEEVLTKKSRRNV